MIRTKFEYYSSAATTTKSPDNQSCGLTYVMSAMINPDPGIENLKMLIIGRHIKYRNQNDEIERVSKYPCRTNNL